MFRIRLDSADRILVLAPRWSDLGASWQIGLLALLLAAPLSLVLLLYRHELRLVARGQAGGLLALRVLMLLVLWLVIGLQPHLVSTHVEELPSRVRVAVDLSASMDVIDLQRTLAEKLRLARAMKLDFNGSSDQLAPAVDVLSRKAIVARILSAQGLNLLERLAARHHVEIVGFHRQSLELTPAQLWEKLSQVGLEPATLSTDLRQPLEPRSSRQNEPLLGIVLFSDGRHTVGTPPYASAGELGKQRIPIYPVVIGAREPPNDVAIVEMQAPTKIFKDASVPVEIRCKITNLPTQDITVDMQIDGQPALQEHRKVIRHRGKDEVHTVRFQAKMEQAGAHTLTANATAKGQKEITLANNRMERVIRVAEEKARVLLVDGDARWEYHYIAGALNRDPTVQLDRALFFQPRLGLIKEDQLEKLGYPRTKLPEAKADPKYIDPLMAYDCILLGDASPEQLPIGDRRRLEKYVAERGGTLIMIAGKRFLPLAYTSGAPDDDPIRRMLPIAEPRVFDRETGFTLHVTQEGKLRPFMHLEPDQAAFTWPELPKHYWGIVGKRKPAASVLLVPQIGAPSAKEESETGIMVQHNHGYGRVIFVGLDSTWRWRFRVGDTYHHRFWGQLVRWSAADKLLPAGNRFVRYGPRDPVYTEGQEVELAVRIDDSLPPLSDTSQARAKVYRRNPDGREEKIAVVPLAINARQKNNLAGTLRDLAAGTYRMELDIPPYRAHMALSDDQKSPSPGRDLFRILPRPQEELLDLSTNVSLLQTLASQSDGKLYTPEDVLEILDRLGQRIERKEHREESRPWRDEPMVWWMLGLLLGLLTLEWGWRKWLDLP